MRLRYHISQGLRYQLQLDPHRLSDLRNRRIVPSQPSVIPWTCSLCVRNYVAASSRALQASHATKSKHVSDTDSDPIAETHEDQLDKAFMILGVEATIGYRFKDSSLFWKAIHSSSNRPLARQGRAILRFLLNADVNHHLGEEGEFNFVPLLFNGLSIRVLRPCRRTLKRLNFI